MNLDLLKHEFEHRKFSIPDSLELCFDSKNHVLKIKGPLGQSELNLFSYQNVIN